MNFTASQENLRVFVGIQKYQTPNKVKFPTSGIQRLLGMKESEIIWSIKYDAWVLKISEIAENTLKQIIEYNKVSHVQKQTKEYIKRTYCMSRNKNFNIQDKNLLGEIMSEVDIIEEKFVKFRI